MNLQLLCLTLLFIQKLAVLKDGFQLDSGSQQELWGSSPSLANSELSIPRLYSDAGSQTDIPAEVSRKVGQVKRFPHERAECAEAPRWLDQTNVKYDPWLRRGTHRANQTPTC